MDRDGRHLQARKISSEAENAFVVYRRRPEVQAVCHAHPPTATGFAAAGVDLTRPLLPEFVVSLGKIRWCATPRRARPHLGAVIEQYVPHYDALLLAIMARSLAAPIADRVFPDGNARAFRQDSLQRNSAGSPSCEPIARWRKVAARARYHVQPASGTAARVPETAMAVRGKPTRLRCASETGRTGMSRTKRIAPPLNSATLFLSREEFENHNRTSSNSEEGHTMQLGWITVNFERAAEGPGWTWNLSHAVGLALQLLPNKLRASQDKRLAPGIRAGTRGSSPTASGGIWGSSELTQLGWDRAAEPGELHPGEGAPTDAAAGVRGVKQQWILWRFFDKPGLKDKMRGGGFLLVYFWGGFFFFLFGGGGEDHIGQAHEEQRAAGGIKAFLSTEIRRRSRAHGHWQMVNGKCREAGEARLPAPTFCHCHLPITIRLTVTPR